MYNLPERSILVFFLVSIMAASLLASCSPDETPIEPPKTQTISGKVLDIMSQALPGVIPPIGGATLEVVSSDPNSECRCECLDDGSEIKTVSDQDGNWTLNDVPLTYDPATNQANTIFIKITAPGYSTAHNQYMPALGEKYDMMVLNPAMYCVILLGAVTNGIDPNKMCIMFGATIGFTDMDYPQKTAPIEGVTAHATWGTPPNEFEIGYFGGDGMTTSMGAFIFIVPDASNDGVPVVTVSGTKPGVTMVGGDFPACPGSFVPAGLIDPFYKP